MQAFPELARLAGGPFWFTAASQPQPGLSLTIVFILTTEPPLRPSFLSPTFRGAMPYLVLQGPAAPHSRS